MDGHVNNMLNKEKIKQAFIERLKGLMIEKNINQSKLSRETHIPQQSISSWLNGDSLVQIDSLVVLAEYFSVTTDYLLGIEY